MFSHILSEHEIEVCPEHNCESCEKTFTDDSKLRDHINEVHKTTEYLCGKCDYKTTDQELFKTHSDFSHEEPDLTLFECDQCKVVFNSKSDLEYHD